MSRPMGSSMLHYIAGFIPPGEIPPRRSYTEAQPASSAEDHAATERGPSSRKSPSTCGVHLICFSKDRAFQLDQLLKSVKRHLLAKTSVSLRISVLYLTTGVLGEPDSCKSGNSSGHHEKLLAKEAKRDAMGGTATVLLVSGGDDNALGMGQKIAPAHEPLHLDPDDQSKSNAPRRRQSFMEDSYALVAQRHQDVRFVREREGEFCDQLEELVREELTSDTSFVLFAVDDMFFYRDVDLSSATEVLKQDTSVFCVHLRLHPGITWSHPASAPCKVPPLKHTSKCWDRAHKRSTSHQSNGGGNEFSAATAGAREEAGVDGGPTVAVFDLLTFKREEGSGEWNYPWDLTGGLYRQEDAQTVVEGILEAYGRGGAANPNLLEFNGERLIRTQKHRSQELAMSALLGAPAAAEQSNTPTTSGAPAKKCARRAPRCACPGRAVMSSLAVNRVQTTYSTPFYASSKAGEVSELDKRLWSQGNGDVGRGSTVRNGGLDKVQRQKGTPHEETANPAPQGSGGFDGSVYRRKAFSSVHVGELAFDDERRGGGPRARVKGEGGPRAAVTVLLPVRNGGAFLLDAVVSVFICAAERHVPVPVELLIIDDGSDDGSMDHVVHASAAANILDPSSRGLEGFGDGSPGTSPWGGAVVVAVPRALRALASAANAVGGDPDKQRCWVRVIRHRRSMGLARCLNEGLREAKADFVARMDADDVCVPRRLKQQVEFMVANPSVSVLGSSVAVFSGSCLHGDGSKSLCSREGRHGLSVGIQASTVQRIARHPTDPALVRWSLFFGCCVAHPSVILRRSAILDAGGFDETTEPAEDYDLWLRVAETSPTSVNNSGEVLLGLRKHANNMSLLRQEEQAAAANAAAARSMSRLLRRSVTASEASAVRCPEGSSGADELEQGARLLGELEAALLEELRAMPVPKVSSDAQALQRGIELIRRDAEARLGAMAVHAMSRFGGGAAPVLDEWRKRYPGRPLLQALTGYR